MKISLRNSYGQYCLTEEDGKRLYNTLKASLNYNQVITIDGIGVKFISSLFFEKSFSPLLKYYSREFLNERIKLININKKFIDRLVFNMDLFEKYYRDPEFKKKLDDEYLNYKTDAKKLDEVGEKIKKDAHDGTKTKIKQESKCRKRKKCEPIHIVD